MEWLKANNPLYRDMVISEERLSQLPETGIPREIMSTVKYSSDVGALAREQDGYVPIDDEDSLEAEFDITQGSCIFSHYY